MVGQVCIQSHEELSDLLLMERTLAGDEQAFERLVQRYYTPLMHFIERHVRDSEQAYDIAQHVWLQLYLFMPKLYDCMPLFTKNIKEPLRAWLFRVAWNRCIQEARRKKCMLFSELETVGEVSLLDMLPDPQPLPEEIVERHDARQALYQAIYRLPPKYRSIVLLRCSQQMSFLEIGRRLNMPENTAKTYFHRALPLLMTDLQVG